MDSPPADNGEIVHSTVEPVTLAAGWEQKEKKHSMVNFELNIANYK